MNTSLRELFPITREYSYLNHAAASPLSTPVVEAVQSQLSDSQHHGVVNYRKWVSVKDRCRKGIARLLNARPEQIAFMRNTSDGLSAIANGLNWKPGDNIVTFRHEFPSNVYPWLRIKQQFGVEVRMCPEREGRLDLADLFSLIDESTRVVSLSTVQYASGFRIDLAAVAAACRRVDALFVLDSIQSLGVIPIDVEALGVDAAAGASHKWLIAPEGVGYLYLSDRARDRVSPTVVGWISVPLPEDYENFEQPWRDGALAWETGTGPTSLFYGLDAALGMIDEIGVAKIQQYLWELADELCNLLLKRGYEVVSSRLSNEKSQIVCVRPKGESTAMSLYSHLRSQKIITAPRGDRLRISPHFYNDVSDLERLVEALP